MTVEYLDARSAGNFPALREILNGCQERSGRYVAYVEGMGAIFAVTLFAETYKNLSGTVLGITLFNGLLLFISLLCFLFGSAHIQVHKFIFDETKNTQEGWENLLKDKLRRAEKLHSSGKWFFASSVLITLLFIGFHLYKTLFCV